MEESDDNLTPTQKAIAMLSQDNQNWLESWLKLDWDIWLSDEDKTWIANKLFNGDKAAFVLEGFESVVAILKAIEAEESRRNASIEPDLFTETAEVDPAKICLGCAGGDADETRFCPDCRGDRVRFDVPTEGDFIDNNADFILAPELSRIGERLIKAYPEDFWMIKNASIDYLWKRKGGSTGNKDTLGKLKKVTAELRWYSQKDFLVILSADHCLMFNYFKVTALVFHELKHAIWDHEKGKYDTTGHDFEGFRREVELFGYWASDIKEMADVFKRVEQQNLFQTMASV